MTKQTEFEQPPKGHVGLLAYDPTTNKWYAVLGDDDGHILLEVTTIALPDGAATATNQANILTELQQKLETADLNLDVAKDLQVDVKSMPTTTVQADGGDKIFAFESIVEESLEDTDLDTGINSLTGTAVGTDKVWKITVITLRYVGTVPARIRIMVIGLAENIVLLDQTSPTSDLNYIWEGEVYLQADDFVIGRVFGATATDDLYLRYCGVQMDAP